MTGPDERPHIERPCYSLIHATFRSGSNATAVRSAWLDSADQPVAIEHIFGLDEDDTATELATRGYRRVVNPSMDGAVTAVRNWNSAAQSARGDVLVVIADDLYPPSGWDTTLSELIGERDPKANPFSVIVSDGPERDRLLMRHPIVSRALFERIGLFSAAFTGLYADDEFTHRAFSSGEVIDGRAMKLDHRHPFFQDVEPSTSHQTMTTPVQDAEGRVRFSRLVNARQHRYLTVACYKPFGRRGPSSPAVRLKSLLARYLFSASIARDQLRHLRANRGSNHRPGLD